MTIDLTVNGSRSAAALLALPVRLHGIRLGQPIDLLLEPGSRRALGFVVLCGDETVRFLPYAAAQPAADEVSVGSALMLLEDVDFYRLRSDSFRSLLGGDVSRGGHEAGRLRDLLLAADGTVVSLVAERDGTASRLDPDDVLVASRRASAA